MAELRPATAKRQESLTLASGILRVGRGKLDSGRQNPKTKILVDEEPLAANRRRGLVPPAVLTPRGWLAGSPMLAYRRNHDQSNRLPTVPSSSLTRCAYMLVVANDE